MTKHYVLEIFKVERHTYDILTKQTMLFSTHEKALEYMNLELYDGNDFEWLYMGDYLRADSWDFTSVVFDDIHEHLVKVSDMKKMIGTRSGKARQFITEIHGHYIERVKLHVTPLENGEIISGVDLTQHEDKALIIDTNQTPHAEEILEELDNMGARITEL